MCMCFIAYHMSLIVLLVTFCNISVVKTQCGTGFYLFGISVTQLLCFELYSYGCTHERNEQKQHYRTYPYSFKVKMKLYVANTAK